MSAFALTAYPMSGAFRAQLEELSGGELVVYALPELRRLDPLTLVRRLRGLRGRCFLPLEDTESDVLLPILGALATVTRADTIDVVRRDLAVQRLSRTAGAAGLASLVGASADAQRALRGARRDLDRLLSAPRDETQVDGRSILYLNANLWFGVKAGGSIAHVAGVVNALLDRGRAVTLATASDPIGVDPHATVRPLRPPRTYGLPVESNLYRFGRSVPAQVDEVDPTGFVYQRHSLGSYAGAVIARRLGVPLVLEYNGSEVWVARNWGRPLRYERLALDAEEASLRHARLVVTISEPLADDLVSRGIERERVVWHPNGVDADRFSPDRFATDEIQALRAHHGLQPDAVIVTFVGTFGHWHGADVLARAIRLNADAAREAGARFLLVGDGLTMPDVRRELAGAEDVAVLAGLVPQADAPLYLAASDILVSPHVPNADGSRFFGSPTKLFEYMAAGKAIVASDLDQVGDVLRDGAGVLVPPGDAEALGRAIGELVADEPRRAALGEAARRRVLERYTWDHHVGAILAALG
jgi:glycosyltransferase involved in cell wall biosynthesis